jgi:hypothetical protein
MYKNAEYKPSFFSSYCKHTKNTSKTKLNYTPQACNIGKFSIRISATVSVVLHQSFHENDKTLPQLSNYLSLSLFPVAPALEHRASVKRFVSIHFINSKIFGKTPWMGDQPNILAFSKILTHDPSVSNYRCFYVFIAVSSDDT